MKEATKNEIIVTYPKQNFAPYKRWMNEIEFQLISEALVIGMHLKAMLAASKVDDTHKRLGKLLSNQGGVLS